MKTCFRHVFFHSGAFISALLYGRQGNPAFCIGMNEMNRAAIPVLPGQDPVYDIDNTKVKERVK